MKQGINSLFLFPYSLFPIDDGVKRESWKIIHALKKIGDCTVFSAKRKPVGGGWTADGTEEMTRRNVRLIFREQLQKTLYLNQLTGILYAALCKLLKLEKAFGHSNPYHRFAFPEDVWQNLTSRFDLSVISYSYWAWLSSGCPKVIVLHDLLSDYMWEGSNKETHDLKTADLVLVISKAEEEKLNLRGVTKTHWSPPAIERTDPPLSGKVGLIGSDNLFNREGLRWLLSVSSSSYIPVHIYGHLSTQRLKKNFIAMGSYNDASIPYHECGIILIPTVLGMGVQIKTVEALAAGRAIIARKGAMRGIPHSDEAWIEANDAQEMLEAAVWLSKDKRSRTKMGEAAHTYYEKHLNARRIFNQLTDALRAVKNQ